MNIYKGENIFNNKKDMLLYKYTEISAYKETWQIIALQNSLDWS